MRALFIGGTGTISMAISRLLVEQGWELYLLNRGSRKNVLDGQIKQIVADISKEQEVAQKIAGMNFDVVCDFIAFVPEQVKKPLAQVLSEAGLRQFHCSESEKFAHVTFFFNGGYNQPFEGETDVCIPSPKGIPFDQKPELSLPWDRER